MLAEPLLATDLGRPYLPAARRSLYTPRSLLLIPLARWMAWFSAASA